MIVGNGSLIDEDWLGKFSGIPDWVGISVDSLVPSTNQKVGLTSGSLQSVHPFAQTLKLLIHDVLNMAQPDIKRPLTKFPTFLVKLSVCYPSGMTVRL